MVVVSLGRGVLLPFVFACAACRELSLPRRAESVPADTVSQEPASPRARRAGSKGRSTDAAVQSAGFAQIRGALRRLVAAEETFFAENGTYTDDLSLTGLTSEKDVKLRFLWLSPEGWAASGTHAELEGRDCVIFVGRAEAPPTTMKLVRSGREGVPVCDERSPPPKPRAAGPAPAPPSRADTTSALDLLDPRVAMKVDLRNLARSQETYFATQGTYARRTASLPLQYLWHRGVRLKILSADAESWSGEATHTRFPGRSCVIWFGPVPQRPVTEARRVQSTGSGVPVCDD